MERKMVLKIPEKGVSDYFILKIAPKKGKSQVQKMLTKASAFERLELSFLMISQRMNSNLKTGCSHTARLRRQLVGGAVLSEGLTESALCVKDHPGQRGCKLPQTGHLATPRRPLGQTAWRVSTPAMRRPCGLTEALLLLLLEFHRGRSLSL